MTEEKKKHRQKLLNTIRMGVTDEAVKALEEYFELDKCTFVFRNEFQQPLAPDYHTMVLQAALRDGNREVVYLIKTLKKERQ